MYTTEHSNTHVLKSFAYAQTASLQVEVQKNVIELNVGINAAAAHKPSQNSYNGREGDSTLYELGQAA